MENLKIRIETNVFQKYFSAVKVQSTEKQVIELRSYSR